MFFFGATGGFSSNSAATWPAEPRGVPLVFCKLIRINSKLEIEAVRSTINATPTPPTSDVNTASDDDDDGEATLEATRKEKKQ